LSVIDFFFILFKFNLEISILFFFLYVTFHWF
jgi:hypothetical protein